MIGRLLNFATCLPHTDGGIRSSVSPKDTASKVAGFLPQHFFRSECQAGHLWISKFYGKVDNEVDPRLPECEPETLTSIKVC